MTARAIVPAALLLALAACADDGAEAPATGSTAPEAATPEPQTATPAPGGAPAGERQERSFDPQTVPIIYMALQDGGSGPNSVIFALDAARDGPRNDTAVRITPEPGADGRGGSCNPQDLRSFDFDRDLQPVFSVEQANAGITVGEIPRYLAFVTSNALVDSGAAENLEATAPQNICVRKYWELWLQQAAARQSPAG